MTDAILALRLRFADGSGRVLPAGAFSLEEAIIAATRLNATTIEDCSNDAVVWAAPQPEPDPETPAETPPVVKTKEARIAELEAYLQAVQARNYQLEAQRADLEAAHQRILDLEDACAKELDREASLTAEVREMRNHVARLLDE